MELEMQINTIISCESDENYTRRLLKNGKKMMVTRSLKEIEEALAQHSFLRLHRSFLVNLNEIEKYIKGDGGYLIMADNSTVDVSKTGKKCCYKNYSPQNFKLFYLSPQRDIALIHLKLISTSVNSITFWIMPFCIRISILPLTCFQLAIGIVVLCNNPFYTQYAFSTKA